MFCFCFCFLPWIVLAHSRTSIEITVGRNRRALCGLHLDDGLVLISSRTHQSRPVLAHRLIVEQRSVTVELKVRSLIERLDQQLSGRSVDAQTWSHEAESGVWQVTCRTAAVAASCSCWRRRGQERKAGLVREELTPDGHLWNKFWRFVFQLLIVLAILQ